MTGMKLWKICGTFSSICLFVSFFKGTSSSCTYPPTLDGVFYSSHEGSLTWNSTSFGKYTITTVSQTFSDLEFECFLNDGNYYIGRSGKFVVYAVDFYAYICLDMRKVSDNFYYYYYGTTELLGANGARVKIMATTSPVTSSSTICDVTTPYPDGSFSILYKESAPIASEARTCPTDLVGYFDYTLNDGSTTHCVNDSHMDACTDTSKLTFDYNTCNATNALYSASGDLYCMYLETVSTTNYLILYNTDTSVDDTSTFRTICMMYEAAAGGVRYATQYPKECQNSTNMNTTAVISPGGTLVFTLNGSCPVPTTTTTTVSPTTTAQALTSENTSSASIAAGVIGALVAVAAIFALIGGVWYIQRKKNGRRIGRTGDKEDIIPQDEEITSPRNGTKNHAHGDVMPEGHAETNSRTLFTPTNKIPTEDGEILSDRQITLENASNGDLTLDDHDGTSLTDEYGEIQADEIMMVSEKTTMSEMTEASLPVYSETVTPVPTNGDIPGIVVEETTADVHVDDKGADVTAAVDVKSADVTPVAE